MACHVHWSAQPQGFPLVPHIHNPLLFLQLCRLGIMGLFGAGGRDAVRPDVYARQLHHASCHLGHYWSGSRRILWLACTVGEQGADDY